MDFSRKLVFSQTEAWILTLATAEVRLRLTILGFAYALALQSDDKIGQQDKCSCSLNPTGTVDTTFGSGGRLTTNIAFPS